MADNVSKQPQNVAGPWYADTSCAFVSNVSRGGAESHHLQPRRDCGSFFQATQTPQEMAAAERAMEVCPTLAIGNDG
jgi:hypothetical protein